MRKLSRLVQCQVLFVTIFIASSFSCSIVTLPVEVARDLKVILKFENVPLQMEVSVLEGESGKVVQKATTDVSGRAEFRNLTPGFYTIVSPVSVDAIRVVPKNGGEFLRLTAVVGSKPVEIAALDGTITDPTGLLMPDAVVVLEAMDTLRSPVAVALTNSTGKIAMKMPMAGWYELKIARSGFETVVVPVKITETGWRKFKLAMRVGSCPPGGPTPYKIEQD